jgi:hypothetical protein
VQRVEDSRRNLFWTGFFMGVQASYLASRPHPHYADDSLGPRFLGVELAKLPGTMEPAFAIFQFEPWPRVDREADEADRQRLVREFVELFDR